VHRVAGRDVVTDPQGYLLRRNRELGPFAAVRPCCGNDTALPSTLQAERTAEKRDRETTGAAIAEQPGIKVATLFEVKGKVRKTLQDEMKQSDEGQQS
jgi:hypothetical protein